MFLRHGFRRTPVSTRGMSSEVPMDNPRCLMFRMRSLLGLTVRADVIAYLVTEGKGYPSQISRVLGFSQKQVQDILVEMSRSGLVRVRGVGRRRDYWLEADRWMPF